MESFGDSGPGESGISVSQHQGTTDTASDAHQVVAAHPEHTTQRESSLVSQGTPASSRSRRQRKLDGGGNNKKGTSDYRLLKEAGGACIFCKMRNSKCGGGESCTPCIKAKRTCIRDHSKLWLLSPGQSTPKKSYDIALYGSYQATQSIITQWRQKAFHAQTVDMAFNISLSTGHLILVAGIDQFSLSDPNPAESWMTALNNVLTDQFSLPAHLESLTNTTPSGPLVAKAIDMWKIHWTFLKFYNSYVSFKLPDTNALHFTLFYLLALQATILCKTSADFGNELWKALQKRHHTAPIIGGDYSSRSLSPLGVAVGLYHNLIKSLAELQLQLQPPLTHLFAHVPDFGQILSRLRFLLTEIPRDGNVKSTSKYRPLMDELDLWLGQHIPSVSCEGSGYELMFWTSTECPTSQMLPLSELFPQEDITGHEEIMDQELRSPVTYFFDKNKFQINEEEWFPDK